MLEFNGKCTIGIDLAASSENPTGWALLKDSIAKTSLVHADSEILENIARNAPALIAIDAPLNLPKKGEFFRKADREMIKRGYRVFSPNLPTMKKLTLRAVKLNSLIEENSYKTIEVHPTSTRKALQMPLKDWETIQEVLKTLGLKGELETRPLATHEIDAVTAALTATLHLKNQTEPIGDEEEGYIIVPKKRDWRTLTT
jgi:predicted nuclease with RNAse H fold